MLTAGHCGDVEERGPGGGKRWSEIDPEKLTVHPGLDDKKKARRSNGVTVAKIHLHPTYKAKGTQGYSCQPDFAKFDSAWRSLCFLN